MEKSAFLTLVGLAVLLINASIVLGDRDHGGAININECKDLEYGHSKEEPAAESISLDLFLDADSTQLFLYPRTHSVNILIPESKVVLIDKKTGRVVKTIDTKIGGVANIINDKYQDCGVFVRPADNSNLILRGEPGRAFDKCVSEAICRRITPREEDARRAMGRDFPWDAISLWSRSVYDSFENLQPPSLQEEEESS